MYFYNADLPGAPQLLDPMIAWENDWLNFACENRINAENMRLEEGEKLSYLDINNYPAGLIKDIVIGYVKKELIVVPNALYMGCRKDYYPDWLKERLSNPIYDYEIWTTFMAPLTGLLRVCWNHKQITNPTREVPCVYILRRHS